MQTRQASAGADAAEPHAAEPTASVPPLGRGVRERLSREPCVAQPGDWHSSFWATLSGAFGIPLTASLFIFGRVS